MLIPDEPPTPVQTKVGPLGQVLKTNPSANTAKKKGQTKFKIMIIGDGDVPSNDTPAATPVATAPDTPKKPKPTPTKKKKAMDVLPPVIMAAG